MKNIEKRFAEAEERVRALVAENAALKRKVRSLEQLLDAVQGEGEDLSRLRAEREQVRERIERVLKSLEAMGGDE